MKTNNNRGNAMCKWIFALVLGTLALPINSFALGLGDIQVNSMLNQQLDARIDLISALPQDAEVLIVKLASAEEFIKAGIDRPHELSSLKFKVLVEDGRVYLTVKSPKPVREPSMNFLIEVDWPKGHLIRQYTILLEPPASMRPKATQQAVSSSNRPAMSE
jgi:pilus assembly protein FimV